MRLCAFRVLIEASRAKATARHDQGDEPPEHNRIIESRAINALGKVPRFCSYSNRIYRVKIPGVDKPTSIRIRGQVLVQQQIATGVLDVEVF